MGLQESDNGRNEAPRCVQQVLRDAVEEKKDSYVKHQSRFLGRIELLNERVPLRRRQQLLFLLIGFTQDNITSRQGALGQRQEFIDIGSLSGFEQLLDGSS